MKKQTFHYYIQDNATSIILSNGRVTCSVEEWRKRVSEYEKKHSYRRSVKIEKID